MSTSNYTPKQIYRFWSKVALTANPDKCWEWRGSLHHSGYGKIMLSRKLKTASRVAWEITHGEIPEGIFVCHHCDNRGCVNPNHLFLGTHQDNMRDMVNKRRHLRASRRSPKYLARFKLSREDVDFIIEIYKSKQYLTMQELGDLFGVSKQQISNIINGKCWKQNY